MTIDEGLDEGWKRDRTMRRVRWAFVLYLKLVIDM